jgi:porin
MKKFNVLMVLLAVIVQCYGETGEAASQPAGRSSASGDLEDIWARDKLTGNWCGLRTDLAEQGINIDVRLSQYYQAVTSGGRNTNGAYGGKFDYILNLDGEKIGLWKGFFVTMHAETQFGQSIAGDAGAFSFPNTAMLYPLPNYRGTSITGFLLQQALSENFVLAAGKINVIDLWSMLYPHTGGGVDGFMNINMTASALPWLRWVNLSVMGGGAMALTDDGQIQSGVFVFDSQNSTTTSGFNDLFEEGTAIIGLWRFFFDVKDKPASLLFAAGGSSRDYKSLDKSDWGFIPGVGVVGEDKEDTWSAAAYYDQVFWQAADNDKKNMRLYTGWSLSDGNPGFGRWGGFASVEGWGLIPKREEDRMGAGFFYNEISSDVKNLTSVLGVELRDIWGVELYYNAEITPCMHVTGDVQFVRNLNRDDDTAVILGLRAVVDF